MKKCVSVMSNLQTICRYKLISKKWANYRINQRHQHPCRHGRISYREYEFDANNFHGNNFKPIFY